MDAPPFKRAALTALLDPPEVPDDPIRHARLRPACCADAAGATSPVACGPVDVSVQTPATDERAGAADAADAGPPPAATGSGRARLSQLDPHLHCSVIGTCLGTDELRRLMARFIDVHGLGDLEVHHEAVMLASQGGRAARALHKALDQRHAATLHLFATVHGSEELRARWAEALQRGDVTGAYWALLTHRDVDASLRQLAFGDVHMLSHLAGSAHRADVRRMNGLAQENAELRERLGRSQQRSQALLAERDHRLATLGEALSHAQRRLADAALPEVEPGEAQDERLALAGQLALQVRRREQAERRWQSAEAERARLQDEVEHLRRQLSRLAEELERIEVHGPALWGAPEAPVAGAVPPALGMERPPGVAQPPWRAALAGRRILYVGGRPSSSGAIRDLVLRHGGNFQRHDGGLEDRKGLLAAAVAAADLVMFPVDCVDHDSVATLKRACARSGTPFVALRSASITSFVAGLWPGDSVSDAGAVAGRPGGGQGCARGR
ncbi:DUF2325 domain-containing protein [Piscinibacter sakaiensis]|uniref:Membrane protein n=1 Tax=Piscinibacter sakaiensis TaxID=1547922 RepID=A0A0K8NXF9_PISS1|nr:DUF2325 domain-containing protein [Piscinibacter sakaiensis]GAP34984.1 membrane protein [Piscinibacter sakaiensis]